MTKLDERLTELIAVGASISANCQPCLQYHVGKARQAGAGAQEVNEAVEVGKMVRTGAAAKMDRVALTLTEAPAAPAPPGACGCGS